MLVRGRDRGARFGLGWALGRLERGQRGDVEGAFALVERPLAGHAAAPLGLVGRKVGVSGGGCQFDLGRVGVGLRKRFGFRANSAVWATSRLSSAAEIPFRRARSRSNEACTIERCASAARSDFSAQFTRRRARRTADLASFWIAVLARRPSFAFRRLRGALQFADGPRNSPIGLGGKGAADKGTQRRRRGFDRKVDRRHDERRRRKHCRHAGGQRLRTVGLLFVAAAEEVSRRIEMGIENRGQPIAFEVGLAGEHLHPHLVRLENRAEAVIVDLREGIELVVVAPCAIQRDTEKRLRGMFDRGIEPGRPVEQIVISYEKPRGPAPPASSGAISSAASISSTMRS